MFGQNKAVTKQNPYFLLKKDSMIFGRLLTGEWSPDVQSMTFKRSLSKKLNNSVWSVTEQ